MRRIAFALILTSGIASAQDGKIPSPGTQQPLPAMPAMPVANAKDAFAKLPPALQGHLLAWEKKTQDMQSLYVKADRKSEQTIANKVSNYSGFIRCMKPNLAYLRIDSTTKKEDFGAYICDGKNVYEYQGAEKTIVQHAIPAGGKGNVGDNLLLEFMSGAMSAADVAARFDLSMIKEDQHYVYLSIKPLLPKDQQEFDSLILVLYSANVKGVEYLPARVQMKINGGQVVDDWTFSGHVVNPSNIKTSDFNFVPPPQGWTVKAVDKKPLPTKP